jgi:hypothetical protein
MKRKSRLTLNIVTLVNFLVVMFLLSGAGYIVNLADQSEQRLNSNIEVQNRQHARSFLLYLNDKMTRDVESGELDINDEEELIEWASDNIRTVKNDSTYNNIAVIKVEYSKENDEFIGNYMWSAVPTTPVTNNLGYKTTYDLMVVQEKAKEYFGSDSILSNQHLISYNDIKGNKLYGKDTVDALVKEDIILFKNPDTVQNTLDAMYQGSVSNGNDNFTWVTQSNDRLLIEWTTVPLEANIGINGEPKTDKGVLNPNYKRIVIACSINDDYIKMPFKSQFDELGHLENVIHISIIIFVALSIILMLYCTWLIYYNENGDKK